MGAFLPRIQKAQDQDLIIIFTGQEAENGKTPKESNDPPNWEPNLLWRIFTGSVKHQNKIKNLILGIFSVFWQGKQKVEKGWPHHLDPETSPVAPFYSKEKPSQRCISPSPGGVSERGWAVSSGWCQLPCSALWNRNSSRAPHDLLWHIPQWNPQKIPSAETPPATQGTRWLLGHGSATRTMPDSHFHRARWHLPLVRGASETLSSSAPSLEPSDSEVLPFLPVILHNSSSWHQWEPTHTHPHHKVWPLSNTQLFCCLPYTQLEPSQLQNA